MEGPVPTGTVSRQPLFRSHAWQVEWGGIWRLGSAGNFCGLISPVTLLQGLACFRQGTLAEHFLCAWHGVLSAGGTNRDKTVCSPKVQRVGCSIGGWSPITVLPLTIFMTWLSHLTLPVLCFLICKIASHIFWSCDDNLSTDSLGLTLGNINKYLQSRSSSWSEVASYLEITSPVPEGCGKDQSPRSLTVFYNGTSM